jgi:beta-glucosidase
MIGQGASRSSLELPGRQVELLRAVLATGTPGVNLLLGDASPPGKLPFT